MKHFKVRKWFLIPFLLIFTIPYIAAAISDDIEVHYVYKVLPAFVLYTDGYNHGNMGVCKGIFVSIVKAAKGDKQVLDHELIHVKQEYRHGFQTWLPLLLSEKQLVKMECEAYAIEVSDRRSVPIYASMIQLEYAPDTPITYIEEQFYYYWDKLHGL